MLTLENMSQFRDPKKRDKLHGTTLFNIFLSEADFPPIYELILMKWTGGQPWTVPAIE